jgi:hypothetical protein
LYWKNGYSHVIATLWPVDIAVAQSQIAKVEERVYSYMRMRSEEVDVKRGAEALH